MSMYRYTSLVRPIYEGWAIGAWLVTALVLASGTLNAPLGPSITRGLIGLCVFMALYRGATALRLWVRRRRFHGFDLSFIELEDLRKRVEKHPDAIWLGHGYDWTQAQTQLMTDIVRADPDLLAPRQTQKMGQRWLHGLSAREHDIYLPLQHSAGHTLVIGTTGSGKALPMDARVHTPRGWLTMKDVKVGTVVSTPDGGQAPIIGVFPQGDLQTYFVHLNDGRVVEASGDHLWEIHHKHWNGKYKPGRSRTGKARPRIMTTLALKDQIAHNKGSFCVPYVKPVAKPHKNLPIAPYVLGVLLGDGLIGAGNRLEIHSADPEIIGRVAAELPDNLVIVPMKTSSIGYRILMAKRGDGKHGAGRQPGGSYAHHPMRAAIEALGLAGSRSWEKKIPAVYLEASIEQRVALLQGLMDADGTASKNGDISITSTSRALLEGLQEIVWSLGGRAVLRQRATPHFQYKGERRVGRPAFKLSVQLAEPGIAFSLERKRARCPSDLAKRYRVGLAVTKIVKARMTPCQCIKVDHPAELFITDHYVATHNTRMFDLLIAQAILRGEPVVIIDPKGDHDLAAAARNTLAAVGRPQDFMYFHPAFPDKSVRVDPMRNFARSTELATRVATLIPSETGSDPFAAFGQMAINNIVQGLLLVDEKPSLVLLRRFLEGGPEGLVVKACRAYFVRKMPDWETRASAYTKKVNSRSQDEYAGALIQFYRDQFQPHPDLASSELEGLFSSFEHERGHFAKMVTSLMPILNMLTTGALGGLLSPDHTNMEDPRPITDFKRIIHNAQVLYIGLDSLSDVMVGSAIGALMLSDLTAVAGDRYNYGTQLKPVNIFIDEAAEVINDPLIATLNKGRGAMFRCTIATQTLADFAARVGSEHKARMIIGNLNNLIALRVLDGPTQEYIAEGLPKTVVRHVELSHSSTANSQNPLVFSGAASERLTTEEVDLVPPAVFGCLPDLEFFARISAGRLIKMRIPILNKSVPPAPGG